MGWSRSRVMFPNSASRAYDDEGVRRNLPVRLGARNKTKPATVYVHASTVAWPELQRAPFTVRPCSAVQTAGQLLWTGTRVQGLRSAVAPSSRVCSGITQSAAAGSALALALARALFLCQFGYWCSVWVQVQVQVSWACGRPCARTDSTDQTTSFLFPSPLLRPLRKSESEGPLHASALSPSLPAAPEKTSTSTADTSRPRHSVFPPRGPRGFIYTLLGPRSGS